jgi:hypothetical protein
MMFGIGKLSKSIIAWFQCSMMNICSVNRNANGKTGNRLIVVKNANF